ncbi:YcgN family cysteine cluster protein [uncultured Bosea sp.]|uniref:YcgN family cysteine cluster protein n=1 Tax=uncultured Bosea sp. TaxID=211457 RepID=UPI0025F9BD3D|nr:YcgN family cysteine cluster protein [uncultured Bosea sp.]
MTQTPPKEQSFWLTTPLEAMSREQWESLCDGCGRCCLVKLEDEDTGRIFATDVGCRLFEAGTCRCRDYPNRSQKVPDCVTLTPEEVRTLPWLPPTCGYRLVAEGKDLPWWHPLVSGDPETVVAAGISVRGRVFANEDEMPEEEVAERIVNWPLRWPRAARGKGV